MLSYVVPVVVQKQSICLSNPKIIVFLHRKIPTDMEDFRIFQAMI